MNLTKTLEMEGKWYGSLRVMSVYQKKSKGRTYCSCKCICGKIVERRTDYLVDPKYIERDFSCGCRNSNHLHTKEKSRLWKGCGDVSGLYFANIKQHAKKRGWELNITVEYIWDLFLKQDKKCALSGIELVIVPWGRQTNSTDQTASLDRIDSNKGYIEGNVHWVHKDINKSKMEFSVEKYVELCTRVAEYQKTKPTAFPTRI